MAKRDIVFCGDPILRRKAKPIKEITPEVVELLADMAETMIEAPGVGLAAPQVGESVRAITVLECGDGEDRVHALINPRIVKRQGEEEGPEGCLSLPTLQGMVTRAAKVKAEGLDVEGNRVQIEAEGLLARALRAGGLSTASPSADSHCRKNRRGTCGRRGAAAGQPSSPPHGSRCSRCGAGRNCSGSHSS